MESSAAILGAIIAGASFALHETSAKAVRDAYSGVKRVLIDTYNFVCFPLLEKDPKLHSFQVGLKQEIDNTPEILDDQNFLNKVEILADELRNAPSQNITQIGLNVDEIDAFRNIILARIDSISARKIHSTSGDVVITDVGVSRGN